MLAHEVHKTDRKPQKTMNMNTTFWYFEFTMELHYSIEKHESYIYSNLFNQYKLHCSFESIQDLSHGWAAQVSKLLDTGRFKDY